jgi:ACR3 family arsenite transporter
MSKLQIGFFERYLSVWVILCIVTGIFLGSLFGDSISVLSQMNIATVNIPVAILVWMMIFPMMVQIDFKSILNVKKNTKGLGLTLTVNWLIKPFSMAFIAWIFFDQIFSSFISKDLSEEYIAGAILLGAAPCTAMVFVWSYLTKGDPEYTVVQVAINDLVLLFAFIPIVSLLLGVSNIEIPYNTLASSVIIFVVIPLLSGFAANLFLRKYFGDKWFKETFLKVIKPFSIAALLLTSRWTDDMDFYPI